ncbi:MAG: hypothetical protein WAV38_26375 [Xanthobacteraceae bacterium]
MTTIRPEITGQIIEPLGVSPRQTGQLLNIGQTRVWHLIGTGELETYWEGRCRKVTMRSIHARHGRQLAAAREADAATQIVQSRRRGRPRRLKANEATP